jgi:hypothetical protein
MTDMYLPITSGRLTSVTMTFDEIVPGATHHSKSKLKKVSEVKSNLIDFDNLSRVDVIKRIFEIHGISEKYDVSPVRGPDFKLWYSGSRSVVHYTFAVLSQFVIVKVVESRVLQPSVPMKTIWCWLAHYARNQTKQTLASPSTLIQFRHSRFASSGLVLFSQSIIILF